MLYEVITPELVEAIQTILSKAHAIYSLPGGGTEKREVSEALRCVRALSDVITSYSIHYTKLYDSGGGRNRDITVDTQTLFHRLKGDWTYRYGGLTSVFTPYAGYDLARFGFGETTLDADVWTMGARDDL